MRKNEKGVTLISLLGVIIIFVIAFIIIINQDQKINDSSGSIKKEDRSTYIAKCSSINYDSLARNPNLYLGNNYTFTGEVIQVINDNNDVTLRVNVTPKEYEFTNQIYYTDTILVGYTYSSSSEAKILEGDIISIYGKSMGTYTYESIMGVTVTVPSINAMYIDIKSTT